jgi:tRNA threonylcarbamoyl adenosine modification protein YeaZ/ribosomal-protein-alanine acetyltransferase
MPTLEETWTRSSSRTRNAEYNIQRMVTLAIDSSTRAGSVAVSLADGTIDARPGDTSRTPAERLPQDVLDLLAAHSLTLADVDRFGVIIGPGSFTGLRVGLAAIQGFALAGSRLVVPVPTLRAILDGWLATTPSRGVVVTWLDGQRGDAFYAAWRLSAGPAAEVAIEPQVGQAGDIVRDVSEAMTRGTGEPLSFVGIAQVHGEETVRAAFRDAAFYVFAGSLAAVAAAWARDRPELGVAPHALRPIYLRRPDAELARIRAGRAQSPSPQPDLIVTRMAPGADFSEVAELQRRAFTNPWGAEAMQWELAHTDVARLYAARNQDGRVVAYCACWLLFDELHINSLAVEESLRRTGIARRLLHEVFREAVAGGARSATLEVRRSNEAARRLYETLGFAVEGVRRDYYQLPREDALILWHRDLAGAGRLW